MNIHELPAIMYICIYVSDIISSPAIYIIIYIYIYHFRFIYSMFVCYFAMETPSAVKDFEPEVSLSWFPPRSKEEWHRRMDGCQVLSGPWPVSWPNSCTQSQKKVTSPKKDHHLTSRPDFLCFFTCWRFPIRHGGYPKSSILDFLKWGLP